MAESVDTVDVEAALLVSPSGVLILAATATNLDPFKRINLNTHHLWLRLAANGQHVQTHTRLEFATCPKPRKRDTKPTPIPRPIAHGPVLSAYGLTAFRFLGVQLVADLMMVQDPPADDVRNPLVHLIASIEPVSYDWARYQTLCARFEAEK